MTDREGAGGRPLVPSFLSGLQGATARISSLSHLRDPLPRRILSLAGISMKAGWPKAGDYVAVWGNRGPTARRGAAIAARSRSACLYLEDPFLRSVRPGRAGAPVHGLIVDTQRPHYDASGPSDLEDLLAHADLAETKRGQDLIDTLRRDDLSKYNTHVPDCAAPEPGYVLVIDQLRGDASIAGAGADAARFQSMLDSAKAEHPNRSILIKAHPAARGSQDAHFGGGDAAPVSPWRLLDGAHAIYTVSSQLGFEAILAGHRPHVFGQPFYAGWGLSDDRVPIARRDRVLTAAQLALGALALYPLWYDIYRDQLCAVETVLEHLSARARAWREDHMGAVAHGMSRWKRHNLRQMFRDGPARFEEDPAKALGAATSNGKPLLSWASRTPPLFVQEASDARTPLIQVEDGFLRSKGLGAELVPPLSLVRDGTGIYYDPTQPSDLEQLITEAATRGASERGKALLSRLRGSGLSKYNLDLPPFKRPCSRETPLVLVVGQVADDASVRLGATGGLADTQSLLAQARAARPDAHLVLKPHPDVEAGLRPGETQGSEADTVAAQCDPISALLEADEVWTISSLLGFEALLRNKTVVCTGVPFYAGWGLTRDLAPAEHPAFARRSARPDLAAMVEAVLVDYPRYHDPVTNLPCPVEVVLDRLEHGPLPKPGRRLRILSGLQDVFASQAWLWR